MSKLIFGTAIALLLGTGTAFAQHGGGGHGGGGHAGGYGGHAGGYGGYGGYGRGGYGGYGGYGRGYYGGYGLGFYGGYGLYGGYGYPYGAYYGGYGLGYDYPYYGGYGYGSYSSNAVPVVPYASDYSPNQTAIADATSTSGYRGVVTPPPAPTATLAPASATIAVRVPEGAQVWFDGKPSQSLENSKAVFTSDKLEPGKTYTLNIKASWKRDGKEQSFNIPLRIEAGDNSTVDLTQLN